MKTNLRPRDYHSYEWSRKEFIYVSAKAILLVIFLSYFFYRSIWAVLPLLPVGITYFCICRDRKRDESMSQLTLQFKECILAVSASLKAGYAVENAFLESRTDMELLYGRDSCIYQELELIRRGLVINITLEEQLNDLANRSGSEDIKQFAAVFSIARKSGGNLPEIIRASSELIGRKVDAGQELCTMLSGRQMEQGIMRIMPFGVLGYIGISYPGYFDMLYHNWQGITVMTVCLGIYLTAYLLGEKILQRIHREML